MRKIYFLVLSCAVTAIAFVASALAQSPGQTAIPVTRDYKSVGMTSYQVGIDAQMQELQDQVNSLNVKLGKQQSAMSKMSAVQLHGRMLLDTCYYGDAPNGPAIEDGLTARAIWIRMDGKFANVWKWRTCYDLGAQKFTFAYLQLTDMPRVGNLRIGLDKSLYGMEYLTSHRHITFLERGLGTSMVPSYQLGVSVFNTALNDRITWSGGVYRYVDRGNISSYGDGRNADDTEDVAGGNNDVKLLGRLVWRPYFWENKPTDSRSLLHLGVSGAWENKRDVKYTAYNTNAGMVAGRGATGLTKLVFDPGQLNNVYKTDFEAAWQYGAFSIQGECYLSFLDFADGVNNGNTETLVGAYGNVSYVLTGESRGYSKAVGTFGGIKPKESVFRVRDINGRVHTGWGAWEIAYRYDFLDGTTDYITSLGGAAAHAGDIYRHTFALNWYLTSQACFKFNYAHSDFKTNSATNQTVDAAGIRFQYWW